MRTKHYLLIVQLICCILPSYRAGAQKKFNLTFDSSGKIIEFPLSVVRQKKRICLRVVLPRTVVRTQVKPLTEMLEKTYTYLRSEDNLKDYFCYFEGIASFDFKKFMTDLKTTVDNLNGSEFSSFTTKKIIDDKFANSEFIPSNLYLNNLFLKQFNIRVRIGVQFIRDIPLNIITYKNNCFYFEAQCHKIKEFICANCSLTKEETLSFQLIQTNPLQETLKQWFETKNVELEKLKPENISTALQSMASEKNVKTDAFTSAHGNIKDLKPWFASWFWYTEGKFTIDPIGEMDKVGVNALKEKIKHYNRSIYELSRKKQFIDSVLAYIPFTFRRIPLFEKVQAKQLIISDQIEAETKQKKETEKILADNSKKLLFLQTKSFLNNVDITVSNFMHVRPQFQFDAANKFRPLANTKRSLHRVSELPDNEQGYIVVYNVDSSTVLKFDQQRVAFKDNEEFTEWIAELLSQINFTDITTTEANNLQNFTKSFFRTPASLGAPLRKNDCYVNNFDNPIYQKIQAMAKDYVDNKRKIFYDKSVFEENDPATPLYSSRTEMVRFNSDSPFRDSISIKKVVADKEIPAFVTNVSVGKLRYVQVVIGLAINQSPVERTTIDTTGNIFRVSTSDNRARVVAGFKIYPFQSYNRDRWILPRYPLHRLSLFAGFELLHPLDNFYVGGGYDILPGLGISIGKNFYLKTNYKIENNTITDTFRSYEKGKGIYYSVNLNPLLFVKFIKLFFKSI